MAGGKGGDSFSTGGAGGTGYQGNAGTGRGGNGNERSDGNPRASGGGGGGGAGGGTGGNGTNAAGAAGGEGTSFVDGVTIGNAGQPGGGGGSVGSGGGGGGGAHGFIGQALGAGSYQGGAGGAGGEGNGGGGGGGAGGYGAVVTGNGQSNNASAITGGNGGVGARGLPSDGGDGGGGGGGDGGIGVFFTPAASNATLNNTGMIIGGNGGSGGAAGGGASTAGQAGLGGAGVVGASLTIVNTGSISGGFKGGSTAEADRADAIDFTGGANSLRLNTAPGVLNGGLVGGIGISGSLDIKTGGGNATLSSVIHDFTAGQPGSIAKTDGGTLTLSSANTYSGGTTVMGGSTVAIGSATAALGTGPLRLNGGAIANASGYSSYALNNAIVVGTSGGTVGGTNNIVLNGQISGVGELALTGVVILNADNSGFSGVTYVSTNAAAIFSATNEATNSLLGRPAPSYLSPNSSFYIDTGGQVVIGASNQTIGSLSDGLSGGGTVRVDGTFTTNLNSVRELRNLPPITPPTLSIGQDNTSTTFSGVIRDDAPATLAINKIGMGTLTLSGANTYSGGTIINGGTLAVANDGNLGAASGGLTFSSGTLEITANGFTSARAVTLGTGGGTVQVDTGSATLSGVIADGAGAGSLTVTGPGALILSNTNTYSGGTTVSGGSTLVLNHYSVYQNFDVIGSGDIRLDGGSLKHGDIGLGTISNNLFIDQGGGTINDGFRISGHIAGAGTLTFTGFAKLFSNSPDFTGATVLTNTAHLFTDPDLGPPGPRLSPLSAYYVDRGAILELGVISETISSLSDGPNGGGRVTNALKETVSNPPAESVAFNTTLTLGGAASTSFSGTITDGDNGLRLGLTLASTHTGTLTLSGANTYTRATSIDGGTLLVTGSLGNTAVTVAAGAALGGAAGTTAGTGTIAGSVTVSGTISAGAKMLSDIGTFNTGALALTGANAVFREDVTSTANADLVKVTGAVALAGTLDLHLDSGFATSTGQSVVFIDNDETDVVGGSFTSVRVNDGSLVTLADRSSTFTFGNHTYQIDYAAGTGSNDVAIRDVTPVAPPSNPQPPAEPPAETVKSLSVTSDNVINAAEAAAATVLVTGTLSAALASGEKVVVTIAGKDYVATADGTSFTVQVAPPAAAGTATAHIVSADGLSSPDLSQAYTIDTVAPKAVISSVTGEANHETGHTLMGGLSLADANPTVTIRDGSTVLGTATADPAGHFLFAFTDTKEGAIHSYALNAVATDAAGNLGVSDSFVFNFDYTPNRDLFGTVAHDASSHVGQVYALYEGLLDRAPDQGGAQAFIDALDHGATLKDITQAFLTSAEAGSHFNAASNADYVEQLYGTVLERASDATGKQEWVNALNQGASRAGVADSFVFSTEHLAQLKGAYDAGVFVADAGEAGVARLYHGLLDRAPDGGGLANWDAAVHTGSSLTSIAQSFLTSTEYTTGHGSQTDKQFVDSLYVNGLGRTADAGGEQDWLSQLSHGATRADVAVGILQSQEAQVHLVGFVEQGYHIV